MTSVTCFLATPELSNYLPLASTLKMSCQLDFHSNLPLTNACLKQVQWGDFRVGLHKIWFDCISDIAINVIPLSSVHKAVWNKDKFHLACTSYNKDS